MPSVLHDRDTQLGMRSPEDVYQGMVVTPSGDADKFYF